MNCVILQPSYIPWRGYFDQIRKADIFVFYDDVQYDKRGWRNRNKIKTSKGLQWLTIPVYNQGAQTGHIPIHQIRICWDNPWNLDHLKTIHQAYVKAPFYKRYLPILEAFYHQHPEFLADFTIELTVRLAKEMGIQRTQFIKSSSLAVEGEKTDRLLAILLKIGASHYISGPSARDYIDEDKFNQSGISLEYMEYSYPEYPQLYPPFESQVSILDLLLMVGPDAVNYF